MIRKMSAVDSRRTETDQICLDESVEQSKTAESTQLSKPRLLIVVALSALIATLAAWNVYYSRNLWSTAGSSSDQFLGPVDTQTAQLRSNHRGTLPFDLSSASVPANEVFAGGPPKDGIPALTSPKFVVAHVADYLQPDDRVIGVVREQDARAYPLKILDYHEIVNDWVDGIPVAITYCPLCDSAAVFDRRTELGDHEFGVSGLLYNSNVLMYDRSDATESLWSQLKAEGISGPGAREPLRALPLELTTWSDWVSRYPNTSVLSNQTGYARDYQRSPYAGYLDRPGLMFPAQPKSDRLPAKARVLGVWTRTAARAYPVSAFRSEQRSVEDRLDGKRLVIEFNPAARSLRVAAADDGIQWLYSLWFAWYAFHPDTDIFDLASE